VYHSVWNFDLFDFMMDFDIVLNFDLFGFIIDFDSFGFQNHGNQLIRIIKV